MKISKARKVIKDVNDKKIFIFIYTVLILFLILGLSVSSSIAQTSGAFEFGASNSSRTSTEKFNTSLRINIRKDKMETKIKHDFSKEQSKSGLIELSTSTGIQGNYFVYKDQFVFIGFEYSRDFAAGEDDKTMLGVGYGIKKDRFSIQSGLDVSSTYSGGDVNRYFLSNTNVNIDIPLDKVFEILEDMSMEFVFNDIDDYEFKTDSGILANLNENLYARASYKYERRGKPITGSKDSREWLVKMGVRF